MALSLAVGLGMRAGARLRRHDAANGWRRRPAKAARPRVVPLREGGTQPDGGSSRLTTQPASLVVRRGGTADLAVELARGSDVTGAVTIRLAQPPRRRDGDDRDARPRRSTTGTVKLTASRRRRRSAPKTVTLNADGTPLPATVQSRCSSPIPRARSTPRSTPTGSLSTPRVALGSTFFALALQPDGKIVAAGAAGSVPARSADGSSAATQPAAPRTPRSTRKTSAVGVAPADGEAHAVALDAKGNIVCAGFIAGRSAPAAHGRAPPPDRRARHDVRRRRRSRFAAEVARLGVLRARRGRRSPTARSSSSARADDRRRRRERHHHPLQGERHARRHVQRRRDRRRCRARASSASRSTPAAHPRRGQHHGGRAAVVLRRRAARRRARPTRRSAAAARRRSATRIARTASRASPTARSRSSATCSKAPRRTPPASRPTRATRCSRVRYANARRRGLLRHRACRPTDASSPPATRRSPTAKRASSASSRTATRTRRSESRGTAILEPAGTPNGFDVTLFARGGPGRRTHPRRPAIARTPAPSSTGSGRDVVTPAIRDAPSAATGIEVSVARASARVRSATRASPRPTPTRSSARALDQGMTLFDTAPSYGSSEERLGRALGVAAPRGRARRRRAATACRASPTGRATSSGSASTRRSGASRTDVIDVFLLHSCDAGTLGRDDILSELDRAKSAGKIRATGYSGENEALAAAIASRPLRRHRVLGEPVRSRLARRLRSRPRPRAASACSPSAPLANAAWRFDARAGGARRPHLLGARARDGRRSVAARVARARARFAAFADGVTSRAGRHVERGHLADAVAAVAPRPARRGATVRASMMRGICTAATGAA